MNSRPDVTCCRRQVGGGLVIGIFHSSIIVIYCIIRSCIIILSKPPFIPPLAYPHFRRPYLEASLLGLQNVSKRIENHVVLHIICGTNFGPIWGSFWDSFLVQKSYNKQAPILHHFRCRFGTIANLDGFTGPGDFRGFKKAFDDVKIEKYKA